MPIKTKVTCRRLTGKNKLNSIPSTSFQVQWEKVVSSRFKEQAEKYAKEFVALAFPPNTFTAEQLDDLKFGDMGFYDMLTNLVVRTWIYQFKNGIPIDYELLKRNAESPLTSKMIDGNIFEGSVIFLKIKKFRNASEEPKDLPQLCIQYINSDQFIPAKSPEFMSEYGLEFTGMLYAFYLQISTIISDGFLAANQEWFKPRGSLQLVPTQQGRVNGWITELQKTDKDKYEHLTTEKALQYLAGKITLEQALAPDPAKGGNRKRKCTQRKCTQRKLRKNKRTLRSRTHKRLSTAKSCIMRGK
jgi:hypothetical protein